MFGEASYTRTYPSITVQQPSIEVNPSRQATLLVEFSTTHYLLKAAALALAPEKAVASVKVTHYRLGGDVCLTITKDCTETLASYKVPPDSCLQGKVVAR